MKSLLRDTAISATAPSPSAIALCAFTLWVDHGRPKNTNEAIWLEAEKQLIARKA